MTGPTSPRVFLSHSTRDKDEIQRLRKALADRGVAAWEDVLELRLGDSLDALRDAVQSADAFVLCFEDAEDAAQGKLARKAERVGADKIGELLRAHRVSAALAPTIPERAAADVRARGPRPWSTAMALR